MASARARGLPLLLVLLAGGPALADAEGEAIRQAAAAHEASLVRVRATTFVSVDRLPGVSGGTRRVQQVSLAGVVAGPEGLVAFPAQALDPAGLAYALLGTPSQAEVGSVDVVTADGSIRAAEWLGRDEASGLAFVRVGEAGRAGLRPVSWGSAETQLGAPLLVLTRSAEPLGYALRVDSVRVASAGPRAGIAPQLPWALGGLVLAGGQPVGLLAPLEPPAGADPLRPDLVALRRAGTLLPAAAFQAALAKPPEEAPSTRRRARAWLGLKTQLLTPELAESQGLDIDYGVRVLRVYEGPGVVAGLKAGDILLRLEDIPLDLDPGESFHELIADYGVGEKVELLIRRDGANKDIEATLGRSPTRPQHAARLALGGLGLLARELTYFDRVDQGLEAKTPGAVVVELEADGAASRAGLRTGDVILRVGEDAIGGLEDLQARVSQPGEYALGLRRGDKELTLRVRR